MGSQKLMTPSFGFWRRLLLELVAVAIALASAFAAQGAMAANPEATTQTSLSTQGQLTLAAQSTKHQTAKLQAKKKKKKRYRATIANPDRLPQPMIAVIPGSAINLLSRSSKIPIAIKNDYGSPVRVRVIVQPSNLRVLIPGAVEVLVPANTTVTAQVPVTAIGDGDVVLHASLESFSGMHLTAPVDIQMKVILGVEDAVVYGFAGFVVLLGGIGVVRTVRKNRRNAAEAEKSS